MKNFNEQNIYELMVVPNTPKVNRNEQVAMYVPIASNDAPGVASFDGQHFNVDPLTGRVRIKNVPTNSPQSSCKVFTKEISKTDKNWVEYGKYYKYRILKNEYDMSNINGIDVERKAVIDDEECYENIMFSYKKYATGVIAIVLSEPDDIKVIIKGE